MKKNLFLLSIGFLFIGASIISACTKEGPMGPAGADGSNGAAGKDGTDAAITCGQCHDESDGLTGPIKQYEESKHATGEAFTEGYNGSCSPCHSSQGFKEAVSKNILNASAYTSPSPINCRTCHKIHETYAVGDLALRTVAAVRNRQDSTNASMNFDFGNGNLCSNCHQARTVSPKVDITTANATYKITSNRFGPHHGPQANMVNGYQKSGAPELGTGYVTATSPHATIANGCVTCHKTKTAADIPGGHTFVLSYTTAINPVKPTDYTYTTTSCVPCHTTADALAMLKSTQTEVVALLGTLQTKLVSAGLLNSTTDLAVPGTYDAKYVAAFLNYKYVQEDKSFGVHNPKYIKTLLNNSIAALP
jgi:hypothetical protein